jgi:hypothetical protein
MRPATRKTELRRGHGRDRWIASAWHSKGTIMARERKPTPRPVSPLTPAKGQPATRGPGSRTRPTPLSNAIRIVGPGWEYTVSSPVVLIGRDPSCRVTVDDSLVSREHAVLRIGPHAVTIEDQRSANGVYVNNARIFEPTQLCDGDQVLLGTTELCVFTAEPPPKGKHRISIAKATATAPPTTTPAVITQRAAALDVLGRLADRMLADEQPRNAEQVLADHLTKLLDGARSGLPVPDPICRGATRQALKLARAVHDGKWINYAIELHLRAERAMSREIVDELAYSVEGTRGIDHALFSYYVEWLRASLRRLPPEAEAALEHLEHLELPSSR